MRIEVLGSGGAVTTPRPGCMCRVCVQARELGAPYARTGPSLFVHGPNVLFDTPEESKQQLDRSGITDIAACFYSHWHPDHTMGRRVWETRNMNFNAMPRDQACTDVYLPEQVAIDFAGRGTRDHFDYLEFRGWVRVIELRDGDTVEFGDTRVLPFRLAEDYVYAFLIERSGKRLLVAMDELHGWEPPELAHGVDLAFLPMGLAPVHPLTGERVIRGDHPVLDVEATFEQTLEIVRRLDARRVVLSHIEEPCGLTHDDLQELGRRHGLTFAWDGLVVDVE
jgi:phosphoribosyl 1,2-cyclic phosphate phosphodiesterase